MYLLFNENLTLNTIIPHGDVPRQGGDLNLVLFFPKTIKRLATSLILIRYRNTETGNIGMPYFSCDKIVLTNSSQDDDGNISLIEEEFEPISDDEKYYGFETNVKYQVARVKYKANQCLDYPTKLFGNTDFVIQIENDEGTKVTSKFSIYINETYGLSDDKTLGMTCSEYEGLKSDINKLISNFNISTVGISDVKEYNEETGEIEFIYNEDIIKKLEYNYGTGELTIEYR